MRRIAIGSWSLALFALSTLSGAGELPNDQYTRLLLRFNNSLTGADGETPTSASGVSYLGGILAQAAFFADPNNVTYATAGNLDGTRGTLEFWIQPQWNGNDGQPHWVLQAGVAGGLLIGKDGGNFWRIILNRFGAGGNPEVGAGVFVTDEWSAGEWHHAAFTWDASAVKAYVDGELRATSPVTFSLPSITDSLFHLGSDNTAGPAVAALDELRISGIARSDEEIRDSYLAGITTVHSLAIDPDSAELLPTWRVNPEVTAITNLGTVSLPPEGLSWSSSDGAVADADLGGRIVAFAGGAAVVTGSYGAASDSIAVTVTEPALPPQEETISPDLATSPGGALWEIPVIMLRYLPTSDGVNIDTSICPDYFDLGDIPLADMRARIDAFDARIKFMIEEGTSFRGYASAGRRPSIGYRVIRYLTVYEQTPPGPIIGQIGGYPVYSPDMHQIFERFDLQDDFDSYEVGELWLWVCSLDPSYPSYDPALHDPKDFRAAWESNMSSPLTGDISNSNRDDSDLPVYDRSYLVYWQNPRRSQAEAVHNRGHQLEAMLQYASCRQDGDSDLFWGEFVGQIDRPVDSCLPDGTWVTGRCGWTEMPPNTTQNYDYENSTPVPSDCEDWTPDGSGVVKLVNRDTWGDLAYPWPDDPSRIPHRVESQFYIYWMQNMPGYENGIAHASNAMTNWWVFTGDWDSAITRGVGLYGDAQCDGSPDLVISDETFDQPEVVEACRSLAAGPGVVVTSSQEVRFMAGELIVLSDGFSVTAGASFVAGVDPSLYPF